MRGLGGPKVLGVDGAITACSGLRARVVVRAERRVLRALGGEGGLVRGLPARARGATFFASGKSFLPCVGLCGAGLGRSA